MSEASGLSASKASTSPFASQVSNPSMVPVDMAQESQAAGAVAPNTLPSRPASAHGLRSPSSWFNRTSSSTSSGHLKHSLLDMVPSQPLNRPISSAPPSPASQLQPPTIPALEQLTQPQGSVQVAEASAPSPASPQTSALKEPAEGAEGSKGAKHEQKAEATDEKQMKRDKRMRKTEANMRWQLMRRLADISSDIEVLNHEVARIRYEQSSALLAEEQKELSEQEEQQLEALQQKRLADLVLRQCTTVLKSVLAHKWAFPFAKPVDINIFKDYPNVIEQPMDFATIKAKVDSGAYKGPQYFFDDMKLVFANARRYNPPGSDVNLMANGVEEKFDERWQVLLIPKLAEEEVHMRNDAVTVRKQRLDNAQARQAKELEQHKLRLLGAFDNLHSRIMDAKTLAAAACKPVRQQDKEALLPALEVLSPEHFEWAMSLVHARYPGLPTGPGEEMQFDITCLDSLALRQLMDLSQACARAAKMADGSDAHVTWPFNPVGSGSRGHKPASTKRPRPGTTSPTPCSPNDTFAYAHPLHPAAAPTSAATSAFPEARQPTGKGAPVLQSASPAAQPAMRAAHAQVLKKPDQLAQLPSGIPHQLPMFATQAHTSSLPQPQLLPQLQAQQLQYAQQQQQQAQQQQQQAQQQQQQQAQQQQAQQARQQQARQQQAQQARQQQAQQHQAQQQQALASQQPVPQPQLQPLSQAPLPQSQITQIVMSQPGQSQPAAGVSFERLPSQSGLANHETSAALLSPITNLQQPSAASHVHSPAQTGGSLYPPALPEHTAQPEAQPVAQPVAQRVTQSGPGQSRVVGEPSAVAASKELTLPALVKSSNASDSKNADVLNAQNVAAADGAQPMDLDESVTETADGHAGSPTAPVQPPLPSPAATQQAQLLSAAPAASAYLVPSPLQHLDVKRALPATQAQTQLQRHLEQLSTTISKSRSCSREPSQAAASAQAHAEHCAEGSAVEASDDPQQAQAQAQAVEEGIVSAVGGGDDDDDGEQQQPQPQEGVQNSGSVGASQQRAAASQDSLQDDTAQGQAHDKTVASCAQSSAATQDSSPADSTDHAEASPEPSAEPSPEPETDQASASPEADQAGETRRIARRRQAPRRQTPPTPLASRGAGVTSRKGTGRGRGRGAIPAARAAKQPPRRSTSRSTAGKRRRSPS